MNREAFEPVLKMIFFGVELVAIVTRKCLFLPNAEKSLLCHGSFTSLMTLKETPWANSIKIKQLEIF